MDNMVWALLLTLFLTQDADLDRQLALTRAALEGGDLQTAEETIRRTIQGFPDSFEARFLMGGILTRQGRIRRAEEEFLRTLELNPQFDQVYLVLATLYRSDNRSDAALRLLEKGSGLLPENAEIRYQLADLYLARQDYRAAIGQLREISPSDMSDQHWNRLGQSYLLSGNLEQADISLQQYLKLRGGSVRTLRTLAAVALRRGDSARSWDYIARARRLAPNSTQVLLDFAHISMIENLVGEAAAAFQYLLLMDPDNTQALFELGSAFIHFANFGRCEELFAQYIELKPKDAQGHAMLGYSQYLSSKFGEARSSLGQALELDSEIVDATFYLGMIAYSEGVEPEAERLLREVLSKSPEHGRALLGLGKLYVRQRKLEQAKVELEKAVRQIPTDFEVHFQLSRVYALLGDQEGARREVKLFEQYRDAKERRETESRRTPYSDFGRKPSN